MRAAYVIAVLAFIITSVRATNLVRDDTHCAFADEPFMTAMAVSTAVTDYYVAHHQWPSTTRQLRTQILQLARTMPAADKPSPADVDQLLARFSRIELQPRGRDLILAIDYRAAGQRHHHRMLLHPGRSSDEMLQPAAELK